jgi:hypothetical protein
VISKSTCKVLTVHTLFLDEHVVAVHDHVDVHLGHRAETAADGQDVLLVQRFAGLQVLAIGPKSTASV